MTDQHVRELINSSFISARAGVVNTCAFTLDAISIKLGPCKQILLHGNTLRICKHDAVPLHNINIKKWVKLINDLH